MFMYNSYYCLKVDIFNNQGKELFLREIYTTSKTKRLPGIPIAIGGNVNNITKNDILRILREPHKENNNMMEYTV